MFLIRIFISSFIKKDGSILIIFDKLKDILWVSFGAVLGANFRFIVYEKFSKNKLIKDFRILIVNTLACFLLGFFMSLIPRINPLNFSYPFVLFFLVGFLGSLSTFSTFIYELFEMSLDLKFLKALKLFFISFALAIIALAFGLMIGN